VNAFSTDDVDDIVADLRRAGVNFSPARVLHRGSSIVIGDGNMVARITDDDHAGAAEIIGRAMSLGAGRAPVLEPAHAQPVPTRFGTATVWPQGRPAPDPLRNLGKTLAALHAVDDVPLRPQRETRTRLRARLRELSGVGVDEGVLASLMDITARLPEEAPWLGQGDVLVHGDAHTGNIVWFEGRILLLDTAGAGKGDPMTDLVPVWCSARRGKRGWDVWEEFRDGYGPAANALAQWQHLDEAVLEREILTTIFLAEQWQTRPWVRDEIETRLRTWDDPAHGERWNTGD
jgi:hypothetical protein